MGLKKITNTDVELLMKLEFDFITCADFSTACLNQINPLLTHTRMPEMTLELVLVLRR